MPDQLARQVQQARRVLMAPQGQQVLRDHRERLVPMPLLQELLDPQERQVHRERLVQTLQSRELLAPQELKVQRVQMELMV